MSPAKRKLDLGSREICWNFTDAGLKGIAQQCRKAHGREHTADFWAHVQREKVCAIHSTINIREEAAAEQHGTSRNAVSGGVVLFPA
jgi:hypothetical protein